MKRVTPPCASGRRIVAASGGMAPQPIRDSSFPSRAPRQPNAARPSTARTAIPQRRGLFFRFNRTPLSRFQHTRPGIQCSSIRCSSIRCSSWRRRALRSRPAGKGPNPGRDSGGAWIAVELRELCQRRKQRARSMPEARGRARHGARRGRTSLGEGGLDLSRRGASVVELRQSCRKKGSPPSSLSRRRR